MESKFEEETEIEWWYRKKSLLEKLKSYFSRRALFKELFSSYNYQSIAEGIELFGNLTNIEDCYGISEIDDFLRTIREGTHLEEEDWGWKSQSLHSLACGSQWQIQFATKLAPGREGSVGNLEIKSKSFSKKSKELCLIEFSYQFEGDYFGWPWNPKGERTSNGNILVKKVRGFIDEKRPRLQLVTGGKNIIATIEQKSGVKIDNPWGVFLFKDEAGNIYINPPEYHSNDKEVPLRVYPSFIGDILDAQQKIQGINLIELSYYLPPEILTKPGYDIPGTIQHLVRDYIYPEFSKKHGLEKYIEEAPKPEEITISLIRKVDAVLDENYVAAPDDYNSCNLEDYFQFKQRTGGKLTKKEIASAKKTLKIRTLDFTDPDKFGLNPQYYYRIPEIWRD